MKQKLLALLAAAAILLWIPTGAQAAQELGSIRVTLKRGGGELTLYRVGDSIHGGYRLDEVFGGGIIKAEDVDSPSLAAWLAETEGASGVQRLLDADRSALFSNLKRGLYLVVQSRTKAGYEPFQPFLVELPCGGSWNITARPKNAVTDSGIPATGQTPIPYLGAAGMILSGSGLLLCRKKRRTE